MAIKKTTKPKGLAYQAETRTPDQIAQQAQVATAKLAKPTRYTTPTQDVSLTSPGQEPLPSRIRPTVTPTVTRPTGPAPVNENQIREDVRKRMQSSIDAINANYTNLLSQDRVAGVDRSGQTRAINARSGLIGSDFGFANQEKTTQYNKQQQEGLVARQNAEIASVMERIEERASTEIENRKKEALGQYERDLDAFKDTQTQARDDFKSLAQGGVDLATMSLAQKAALFRQAGYDDQFGELIYNAMKPKPKQIDYKFEKLNDGMGLFYGQDPVTGELKQIKVPVDLPPDWQMQIAPDGTVLGYNKNTGETRMLSEQGQFAAPKDGNLDKIISDDLANELGVPFGTTYAELQQRGYVGGDVQNQKGVETTQDILGRVIAMLDNDKGMQNATGLMHWAMQDSNSRLFRSQRDSLLSFLQLDNIKYLKGTGAISDAEQRILQNASTVLRANLSYKDFKREAENLKNQLEQELKNKQGGSEGTNPKVQSVPTSLRSINTQTLASAVLPKYPQGSNGGQCVTFLHQLASFPSIGDGKLEKYASVDRLSQQGKAIKGSLNGKAQVGMIIITGENPTYGHGAMINAISSDGKYARLTESNRKGNEKVTHDRVIALDSPQIYGAIIPNQISSIA